MPGLAEDISDIQLSPTTPRQEDEGGAAFEPQTGAKQVAPTRELPAGTSIWSMFDLGPGPHRGPRTRLRFWSTQNRLFIAAP